ncbi:exported hypothetical protein [uncultured delta proteobacterium]|uniref:Uncharacterized protein n=1 Tax=uncultured delta proteobacterium TaxID=34034 RepID=A0A212KBW5_9DELT|nr:exported hypothetical protein [uncultured delta proteobacterium]
MRSIGVLRGMRKEKHVAARSAFLRKNIPPLAVFFLAAGLLCLPSIAFAGDATMSTRNNESGITRDPATGDRGMQTPEAKPQPEYQGPQTVIVAPEIYPDGRSGHGVRPGPDRRPGQDGRRPQSR